MSNLPAELLADIDLDAVREEQDAAVERELREFDASSVKDAAGGKFFSRDYIPTDPEKQTDEQQRYLQTAAREANRSGPRDFVPTEAPAVDLSPEEKAKAASDAADNWQAIYQRNVIDAAEKAAHELTEMQFISRVQSLSGYEKNLYLQAEARNRNRTYIFQVLGRPDEGINAIVQQPTVPGIPSSFEGPQEGPDYVAPTPKGSNDADAADEHAEDDAVAEPAEVGDDPAGDGEAESELAVVNEVPSEEDEAVLQDDAEAADPDSDSGADE